MMRRAVAQAGALRLSDRGEEPGREVHTEGQGQDRVLRRLVPVQEGGGCDREHVRNWLKMIVLHTHLEMDLSRIVSFLYREVC